MCIEQHVLCLIICCLYFCYLETSNIWGAIRNVITVCISLSFRSNCFHFFVQDGRPSDFGRICFTFWQLCAYGSLFPKCEPITPRKATSQSLLLEISHRDFKTKYRVMKICSVVIKNNTDNITPLLTSSSSYTQDALEGQPKKNKGKSTDVSICSYSYLEFDVSGLWS